jgi:glycosyltransferase involved in cell wall biosynthesis
VFCSVRVIPWDCGSTAGLAADSPMPRRPRIAFVTYAMHCGGVEAFLLRLGSYLRESCDVEVITTIEPGEWFGRLSGLQIKAHHVAGYTRSGVLAPWQHSVRVRAQLIAGDYDLVFLNHTRHAQATLAGLPEHVVAIPILHNDVEEIYEVGCGNKNAWNAVVGVSPKVASKAREQVLRRPVVEINYGVELPNTDLWGKRPQLSTFLELIFVGRLDHLQKGIFWLPNIYQACLDRGVQTRLTIVGDGPDAPELQRRLSETGLQHRVRHLRGLTPAQVYDLLVQSHILLMPSYYEGLPIALLESLACGCVPVVSRLPGITDAAVVDGETGLLVEVENVAGFADAIARLYNDPAKWSQMSSAAYETAKRRYSVEAMGRSYLDLITDALNGQYPLPRPRKDQRGFDPGVFTWRDFLPDWAREMRQQGRAWLKSWSS